MNHNGEQAGAYGMREPATQASSPESVASSKPLLATKLYIPPVRPNLVARPRLIERLNEGLYLARKLTLISAPAGFGKTTLLSTWLADSPCPAAWLSLDAGDSDPVRFLSYLIAALQAIVPGIGEEAQGLLRSPQPLPIESILTTLVNELCTLLEDIVLVLDNYHLIDTPAIHNAMAFLLDNLPSQMHPVIATRADPPLPLARLRASSQLTDIRTEHLLFTLDETDLFLKHVMGLDLSDEEVAALETRSEGWIAGLQLAALSLQGRDSEDLADSVSALTGSQRYIADYLVEEVLQRQPDVVRDFQGIPDRSWSPFLFPISTKPQNKP